MIAAITGVASCPAPTPLYHSPLTRCQPSLPGHTVRGCGCRLALRMSPLHIVALSLPLDTYIQGIAVYIYRADWTWSRSYSCSWSCAFERVTFIAVWLCSQEKPKPERNSSRSRRRRGSRRRRRRRRQRWLLGIVIFLMIYSARFFRVIFLGR